MAKWIIALNGTDDVKTAWRCHFPEKNGMPSIILWEQNGKKHSVLVDSSVENAPTAGAAYQNSTASLRLMNTIVGILGIAPVTGGIVYDMSDPGYKGAIVGTIDVVLPALVATGSLYVRGHNDAAPASTTRAQRRLQAALTDEHFRHAVQYLGDSMEWRSIYMALEALKRIRRDNVWNCITSNDLALLKRTANESRHHFVNPPVPHPMDHPTAVYFLQQMLDEAAETITTKGEII